jgi:hypothetical protein
VISIPYCGASCFTIVAASVPPGSSACRTTIRFTRWSRCIDCSQRKNVSFRPRSEGPTRQNQRAPRCVSAVADGEPTTIGIPCTSARWLAAEVASAGRAPVTATT